MPSSSSNKKDSLTFRLEPDLKEKLQQKAHEDDRSLSSMVTVILRDWFKKKENNQENDSETISEKIKSLPLEERQAIAKELFNGKD